MAKTITFFGGDSQVGTTFLAASVAQSLTLRKKKTILVLASTEVNENNFVSSPGGSLENLLRLNKLTKEDVASAITKTEYFDMIDGSIDTLAKQFYPVDIMGSLLPFLKREYEYIIIDGGHDATLPVPVSSLQFADQRYYVLTGNQKCITRFQSVYRNILKGLDLNEEGDKIVVNKDNPKVQAKYELEDIQKLTVKLPGITVPEYDNPYMCEFDRTAAYTRSPAYRNAVDHIAEDILTAR